MMIELMSIRYGSPLVTLARNFAIVDESCMRHAIYTGTWRNHLKTESYYAEKHNVLHSLLVVLLDYSGHAPLSLQVDTRHGTHGMPSARSVWSSHVEGGQSQRPFTIDSHEMGMGWIMTLSTVMEKYIGTVQTLQLLSESESSLRIYHKERMSISADFG